MDIKILPRGKGGGGRGEYRRRKTFLEMDKIINMPE